MSAPSILLPKPLKPGDLIGLVAPASPPDKAEVIDETIARLTKYGFKIKPSKWLRQRTSYLAGSDEERAEDINTLFADPKVKGIFALRGGYGSCRILPLLDYTAIRANPKPFLGYSDLTVMHLAILQKSGLVTFHGSNASSAFEHSNEATCRGMLMGKSLGKKKQVLFSPEVTPKAQLKTAVPGRVAGQLIGGNLTCLLRMIGTPYEPDFRRVILFLEDTGEKAYRLDGNFTHLRLAGVLKKIGGLVLGQFDHENAEEQERIHAVLQHEAERIGVPCVSGAPIGHFTAQIMIPQGMQAELDATGKKLTLV